MCPPRLVFNQTSCSTEANRRTEATEATNQIHAHVSRENPNHRSNYDEKRDPIVRYPPIFPLSSKDLRTESSAGAFYDKHRHEKKERKKEEKEEEEKEEEEEEEEKEEEEEE
uniref:Uncharacterized protein n=1 Tax=Vespula pensylvanica TaxID=30213 RepID=A0A834KNS1_VESPE|nr:hypothetical protein H0235_014003 [Vespula pensylvanica]